MLKLYEKPNLRSNPHGNEGGKMEQDGAEKNQASRKM